MRKVRGPTGTVEYFGLLPQTYVEALTCLGKVLQHAHGVVVGGAAVTFYTGGAILSGDFDFVIQSDDAAFAEAMRSEGFVFQAVSGPLFDGLSDPSKLRSAQFGGHTVVFASPEDLIADRMAQQAIASPTDDSRLIQARLTLRLVPNLDLDYMVRRIKQESGDPDLLFEGKQT